MSVIELSLQNFESMVLDNDIVLVDFWASWCAPCLTFASVYEKAAEENPAVIFTKVNIEQESELAEMFSIRSIPHLMVFKQGIVIYSDAGTMPASALKELIEQAHSVDVATIKQQVDEDSKGL